MEIREAAPDDLEAVLRLNRELFGKERREFDGSMDPGWSHGDAGRRHFVARISGDDGIVLVALSDGRTVGYTTSKT